MKAIILAGGLGTRLREETEFRPKPMIEVGGRPVLWHIMKNLAWYGITDFIIATGYKSDMIKDYFLNYEARNNDFTIQLGQPSSVKFHSAHDEADWNVTVAYTGEFTTTGGRVLEASRYLEEEPFLITYGDGLADVDIHALRASHEASGCLATVTTVQPSSRFGVMEVGSNGRVTAFMEKPKLEGWINVGFFIMDPRALQYFSGDCVLEEGPVTQLADEGQLNAFRHTGFWQAMDTYRESRLLNDLWEAEDAPWKTWS